MIDFFKGWVRASVVSSLLLVLILLGPLTIVGEVDLGKLFTFDTEETVYAFPDWAESALYIGSYQEEDATFVDSSSEDLAKLRKPTYYALTISEDRSKLEIYYYFQGIGGEESVVAKEVVTNVPIHAVISSHSEPRRAVGILQYSVRYGVWEAGFLSTILVFGLLLGFSWQVQRYRRRGSPEGYVRIQQTRH